MGLLQSSMTKEEQNVGDVTATPEEALPTIPGAPVPHSRCWTFLTTVLCPSQSSPVCTAPLPGFGH